MSERRKQFCNIVVTLMLVGISFCLKCSRDPKSVECCPGYQWNITSRTCVECMAGYRGINCSSRCRFPTYGDKCKSTCKCNESNCDVLSGCPVTTETSSTDKLKNQLATTETNPCSPERPTDMLTTTDAQPPVLLQHIYNVSSNTALTIGIYFILFLFLLVFGFHIGKRVTNMKNRYYAKTHHATKEANYQNTTLTENERDQYESLLADNAYTGCTNVSISYQRECKCYRIQLEHDQPVIEKQNFEYEENLNSEYDDCSQVQNRTENTISEYEEPCALRENGGN